MRQASLIYAMLCGLLVCFQLALAAGVPWGHLTMGGMNTGVLPPSGRAIAVISAILLVAMATVVLGTAASRIKRRWPIRVVLAITTMTTAANIATPSYWERVLWGPVAAVLLVCAVLVWLKSANTG